MAEVGSIYSAVYSGVPVFEMVVNGVAIMRRRTDSYMNATQILKVASIDKGKRTKILEKQALTGEYEKVQGGYGKYQGTWLVLCCLYQRLCASNRWLLNVGYLVKRAKSWQSNMESMNSWRL